MPRPKNPIRSDQLRITITPQLREQLESLVQTGLFGMNVNEAVHRLIAEGVKDAFLELREVAEGRRTWNEHIERTKGRSRGKKFEKGGSQ